MQSATSQLRRLERAQRIAAGKRPKNCIAANNAVLAANYNKFADWCGRHGQPIPRPWRMTATRGMRPVCGR